MILGCTGDADCAPFGLHCYCSNTGRLVKECLDISADAGILSCVDGGD